MVAISQDPSVAQTNEVAIKDSAPSSVKALPAMNTHFFGFVGSAEIELSFFVYMPRDSIV